MQKKVSVICSVYNTAEYLHDCFGSVEKQTMQSKYIEFIIINDGSSDDSLKIIKTYLKKHPDWILINRENKGLAISRNEGLDIATGEYITFLDSDDYLCEDALENMVNAVSKSQAEIGLFRMEKFNSTIVLSDHYSEKFDNLPQIVNLNNYPSIASLIRSCGILYKRDLLKNIRFIPKVIHEDNYFCLASFSKAKRILIDESIVYRARMREGENTSIMQNLNYKTYKDLMTNIKKADNEIKNSNLVKIHANQMYAYIRRYLKEKEDIKKAKNDMSNYLKEMRTSNIISLKKYVYLKLYFCVKKIIKK